MMVGDRSGIGGGVNSRRSPDDIIKESRKTLNSFLVLLDELDAAIKETREEAQRDRWGK